MATSGTSPSLHRAASVPFREECWNDDATRTLIEAWGDRYLRLNRGNLRHQQWQEVADAVNFRHASDKKSRRTDVQCKNRIDTLKKKYKMEKARIFASNGTLDSSWPFYYRLDSLIGPASDHKKTSPPAALPLPCCKTPPALPPAVLAQSLQEKRPRFPIPVDDSYFRQNCNYYDDHYGVTRSNHRRPNKKDDVNYDACNGSGDVDTDSGPSRSSTRPRRREDNDSKGNGCRQLAEAILGLADIYERVEEAKQKQMIELEKQRIEFAKGLEFQRMQFFMDSQVEIEKVKRTRRAASGSDRHLQ